MTGGRNDRANSKALEAMANTLQAQQNPPMDAFHDLGKFQMSNSLTFKGRYDLEGV